MRRASESPRPGSSPIPVLIDTDVAINLMRHNPCTLDRLAQCQDAVFISSISVSELYFGAYNSERPEKNVALLQAFLGNFQVLTITEEVAHLFGKLKASLKRQSVQVAPFDLMIGSIALENGCMVATGNIRHFRHIKELQLSDWIRGTI